MTNTALSTHLPTRDDAVAKRLQQFAAIDAKRLWERDPGLWTQDDAVAKTISNRLGWLESANWINERMDDLLAWADALQAHHLTDVVLLGMGGSSLAPEVCANVFGNQSGRPRLSVLDNTHPGAITALEQHVNMASTLFVVASKSGSTIETRCFSRYFFERMKSVHGDSAGEYFVAITDSGSDLEREAAELGFSRTFVNPSDIGGRYSALSYFGLVPAAAAGLDVRAMVDGAIAEGARCHDAAHRGEACTASSIGVVLGMLASDNINKLTLLASDTMQPLGVWIEQLVAESTGKQGVGILPVCGESLFDTVNYSRDRLFAVTRMTDDTALAARADALRAAGHSVIEWTFDGAQDLGREFLRWEIATAVAGAVMNINPFDEPNVTESKNKTGEFLDRISRGETIDTQTPDFRDQSLDVYGSSNSVRETLSEWRRDGDYLALLAYGETDAAIMRTLESLRAALGAELGLPATLGIGPRFLHSTGQLHKGGDASGIFVEITTDTDQELAIPGETFSFGELNACQALGDLEVLRTRGRRVIRIHAGNTLANVAALVAH